MTDRVLSKIEPVTAVAKRAIVVKGSAMQTTKGCDVKTMLGIPLCQIVLVKSVCIARRDAIATSAIVRRLILLEDVVTTLRLIIDFESVGSIFPCLIAFY